MTLSNKIASLFIAAGMLLNTAPHPADTAKAAVEAAAISESERSDIRAVIRGQLLAFKAQNAARAYSFAAEVTKKRFGSAQRFLYAMARGYTPVFLTEYVIFEGLKPSRQPIQRAVLTDAKGREWIALYEMQRQPDGYWKILNCALRKAEGWRI